MKPPSTIDQFRADTLEDIAAQFDQDGRPTHTDDELDALKAGAAALRAAAEKA